MSLDVCKNLDKQYDRELFVPPAAYLTFLTGQGRYAIFRLTDGADVFAQCTFKVPDDFLSIISVQWIVIPLGTGDLRWQVFAGRGNIGEAWNAHDVNYPGAPTLTAVTANLLTEMPDCKDALLNLAKGNYAGLMFYRNGSDITDTVNADVMVLGVLMRYRGCR